MTSQWKAGVIYSDGRLEEVYVGVGGFHCGHVVFAMSVRPSSGHVVQEGPG